MTPEVPSGMQIIRNPRLKYPYKKGTKIAFYKSLLFTFL